MSVGRFCRQNLEASFYMQTGLSLCRARSRVRTITILGMTRRHHLPAKLEFLGQVSLTRRTTVNVWPHQKSSSSLKKTMPLIQETLWLAMFPCANLTGKKACLQLFSVEMARGNVVSIINNPSEWMLPRKISSCLSSVSMLCFLFWNIHLTRENKGNISQKQPWIYFGRYHSKQWNVLMCFLCREQITLGCRVDAVRSPKTSSYSQGMSESPRRRLNSRSCSSRSRSRSSESSRYSRHSRSPSLSSCR